MLKKIHGTITATQNLESPEAIHEQALAQDRKAHLDMLRLWQSKRLAATYSDFLASPRYAPACRFFLDDVYAAKDFRKRDEEIRHLYEIIHHFLPDIILKLVKTVIELNDLTETMDEKLWDVMESELGATDTVTIDLVRAGYKLCDNYDERAHQIELIDQVGHMVDLTTKIPMIATTLKVVRGPVTRAGWGELHEWIVRGFLAFQHMHGGKEFLETIHRREMAFLDAAIPDHPRPEAYVPG